MVEALTGAKPLAVCAVFKNEAPFLLEWIAHHRAIGFDHFVLYDNGSDDGGAKVIRSSAFAGCATVLRWPPRPGQLSAYRHFIYNFADACEWAAFIDLDEFLLPLGHDRITGLLADWHAFSAVLVHWRVFGPGGHDARPPGLVTANYTWRAEDSLPVNRHIKSIVKCSDLLDVTINPHEFKVRGPVCDTLGRAVAMNGIQPVACHDNLVLNHYVTRSRQDWTAKLRRGSAMIEMKEPRYDPALFDHYAEVCVVWDDTILRFAPAVRALLAAAPVRKRARAERLTMLSVLAHIQGVGDVEGRDGDWIGRRGGGRWIEGIRLAPPGALAIEYKVVLADGSVSAWAPGGTFCGSRGMGVPVRGFAARLVGADSDRYAFRCSATFTDGSVCGPTGGLCAAASLAPLEALRIVLRRRAGPVLAPRGVT